MFNEEIESMFALSNSGISYFRENVECTIDCNTLFIFVVCMYYRVIYCAEIVLTLASHIDERILMSVQVSPRLIYDWLKRVVASDKSRDTLYIFLDEDRSLSASVACRWEAVTMLGNKKLRRKSRRVPNSPSAITMITICVHTSMHMYVVGKVQSH